MEVNGKPAEEEEHYLTSIQKIKDLAKKNRIALSVVGILLVITLIVAVVGSVVIRQTVNFEQATYERLPTDIYPKTYDIEVQPFFENYTFHTRVNITFEIFDSVQYIILNAYMLENLTASIEGPLTQSDIPISWPRIDVIRLTPLTFLSKGNYTLSMECDGFVTDDLLGLYRSRYAADDTIYPYLFTTKLESSSARRVFPCWDEPQFKARFTITLIGPESQQYDCNMPIATLRSYSNLTNVVAVTFEQTPPMSTYLIAFVIGELSTLEKVDEMDTIQRIIVPKGSVGTGEFALDASIGSMKLLSVYFKRFYPLPKLDLVAVRDFQSGAMEHWGMVTYRESRLLPGLSSPFKSRVQVVETVCHENAHMWFGDLVTMRWWSDLWLNEGFASWIMNLCVDGLHPEYKPWNRFLYSQIRAAMILDSKAASNPVIVSVENTDTIRAIYNDISYRKGSSIIRMLNNYVSAPLFQLALQNYIDTYAYGNTITAQLWEQVSLVTGLDISNLMYVWTSKPGFPYVQITSMMADGMDSLLSLSQKRFFADGTSTDANNTVWNIPIAINCASSPTNAKWSLLMNQTTQTFRLPGAQAETWIKLNYQKSSFFITEYTTEMLNSLRLPTSNKALDSLDRFDLEFDLYMLSCAGHVKMSQYLDFVHLYQSDDDTFVWDDIAANIRRIGMLVEYMSDTVTINRYGSTVFGALYEFLGIDPTPNDTPMTSSHRALALQYAALYDYQPAVDRAIALLSQALTDNNFNPDLREPVFIVNVKKGGLSIYQRLKQYYLNSKSTDDQRIALTAMGYTPQLTEMDDIFHMIFQTGEIRMQDIFYPLGSIGLTKQGREHAWEYAKLNINQILQTLTTDYFLDNFLQPLFSDFADIAMINEMQTFFEANSIALTHAVIQQLFEQIRINSAIVERSRTDVLEYLQTQVQAPLH